MKKILFAFAVLCMLTVPVYTQVTIGTNNPPDPSASLDLQTNAKGFLVPRLTTVQRSAIVSPAIGLQVYNTTTNCLEIYMPQSGWKNVACDCVNPPSANFTFTPTNPGVSTNVTFTPQSPGLNYSWTFQGGNPGSSNLQNPVVQWPNQGTYQISLTVTDNAGCSATTTASITVGNCPPGSQTFAYTGGIQTFTVPNCVTQITVAAFGAEGAASTGEGGGQNVLGGKGASITGTFAVNPGEVLTILVGQKGTNSNCGSGGGGGTFVEKNGTLMVAAGGGGGGFHCFALGAVNGGDGQAGTAGGGGNCTPNRSPRAGGTNGNGGSAYYGGGGGGWLTDGIATVDANNRGRAYQGIGGTPGGGYGGGGGHYVVCCGNSGGGGGYSGGSAGDSDGCAGGGGGSFNAGTNPINLPGIRVGNGEVVISW